MPKRNFTPGNKRNPFQNYSNKRRAQQEMFDSYRKQQQQHQPLLRKDNESQGPRTVQHDDMDVDRGRIPSPPALPPSSSGKENGSSVPTSAGQPAGSDATGDWPPSLKDYVSRAFASVRNEGDRDSIQDLLKKKLTDAFNNGRTKLIDWDKEPLPLDSIQSSPAIRPGLNFNHKNSRWGPTSAAASGFSFREGNRAPRGRGHFQGRRRSPPGYRRPRSRSRSRSRSSSPYSRSSRSYSRSRSRSRSPSSRGGRRDRRRKDTHAHGRKKFRDLGSESDSDSGSRNSRSPVARRRSFVDKRVAVKGARGRGRGAKANQQKSVKKGKA